VLLVLPVFQIVPVQTMYPFLQVIQTKAIEFDEALPEPLLTLLKTILEKVVLY